MGAPDQSRIVLVCADPMPAHTNTLSVPSIAPMLTTSAWHDPDQKQAQQLNELAADIAANRISMEVLRSDRADEGRTGRVSLPWGQSAILKLWRRAGVRGLLRRYTRTTPAMREFRVMKRLESLGVPAPRPILSCRIAMPESRFTEAVFMEDLGQCTPGNAHLKRLYSEGMDRGAATFEAHVIQITASMIAGGILDPDHGLINFVINSEGRLYRLDLELAQSVINSRWHPLLCGRMIGTLIGSHCLVVQPNIHLTEQFAIRLAEQVMPSQLMRRRAAERIDEILRVQSTSCGIHTQLTLQW